VLLGTCNGAGLVLWRLVFVVCDSSGVRGISLCPSRINFMFFSLCTIMQGRVPAIFLQKKKSDTVESVLLLRSLRPQSNKLDVDSVLNCLKL